MITYSILLSASTWKLLKKNSFVETGLNLADVWKSSLKISIKNIIGNLWLIFLYDTPILLGLNMKLLFLVCFLAVLPQFSNGKNYYLVNDEKSASEYVYGLFGLTNVVGKIILDLMSLKKPWFRETMEWIFSLIEILYLWSLGLSKTSTERNLFFVVASGEHTTKNRSS